MARHDQYANHLVFAQKLHGEQRVMADADEPPPHRIFRPLNLDSGRSAVNSR